MTTFENAKVGDRVWSCRFGWGVIIGIRIAAHPLWVEFDAGIEEFTLEGKVVSSDLHPTLFWDEVPMPAPEQPNRTMYKNINGFKVPDIGFSPSHGEAYRTPDPLSPDLVSSFSHFTLADNHCVHQDGNSLCYPFTPEGRAAAIAHALAWLGTGEPYDE